MGDLQSEFTIDFLLFWLLSSFILELPIGIRNQNKEYTMARISQTQIKNEFTQYLSKRENLISIGIFKKVPSTTSLMLTRGMTWLFSPRFYVGVTDQQLIVIPEVSKQGQDEIYAGFSDVEFYTDAFNTTVLDIQKIYQGRPLKLRFKPGYHFQGMDQFDFIAVVKQGKKSPA